MAGIKARNILITLFYTHKPEFFAQINYNKKQLLLFRSLWGGGLRFSLISDSVSNFTFGTAYIFEFENIDLEDFAVHPNKTYHHRFSNFVSYSNSFSKNAFISLVIYAQPRFDNFNDIKILSESSLNMKLTNKFSLPLIFSLRYDSRPPDKVKSLDTNLKVGVNVNF